MKIAIFGGSFNPPHRGHLQAALAAQRQLQPDRFLIMPDFQPPHKDLEEGSPTPDQRLALCCLNFESVPGAECSALEIDRGGKSYTADTVRQLRETEPDAELILLMGTDMFLNVDRWYDAEYLMRNVTLAAFQRTPEEAAVLEEKARQLREQCGAKTELIASEPLSAASTDIREALRSRSGEALLTDEVYAYIIRNRLYGARVSFPWLRERSYAMLKPKRIPHVMGCEEEAVRLAKRWGADPEQAAEAAILHDCTKKEPLETQLALCARYGVKPDALEQVSEKLLHSKTGAAIAEHVFGCCPEVVEAIRWHTTGKADMTLLEKIIYMADYVEPNRDFDGVEPLRKLAYEDLDKAMELGLAMSLEDVQSRGNIAHEDTLSALNWYRNQIERAD